MVAILFIAGQGNKSPTGAAPGIAPKDADQFIRFGNRKRAEEQHVHDAEDYGIGPDTQRQRQHGNQTEARIFPEHPRAITQVLKDVFQHKKVL